jgi:hypothetical protein
MASLESAIENSFVDWAKQQDIQTIKIYRRGWPDRFVIITKKHSFFIEFKRPKESLRTYQKHIQKEIQRKGYEVYKIDSLKEAKELINEKIKAVSKEIN